MKIAILLQNYFVHKYLWPVYSRIKEEILNFQEVTTNVYLSSGANFNVVWIRNSVNVIVFNTENKKKDMKNSVKQSQKYEIMFLTNWEHSCTWNILFETTKQCESRCTLTSINISSAPPIRGLMAAEKQYFLISSCPM